VGEPEAIENIRRDRDAYYQMFDRFFALTTAQHGAAVAERDEYFSRLEPQFDKLRADCEHLLQLNQRAMLAKSEAAAGVAQLWFYRTLLIVGTLVALGLALAFFLARRIVGPLQRLTESTARIAGGDLNA